ncbi:MAG: sulfite exporter TauE/SafE family protein [Burkholderiales bacterium]|nr:sulfite exporter TauE/SafE family protein [Burkholderiales bacterium]
MFETSTLLLVAGTFLLAGAVKGVIGLGLPTVSLALLTVALDLPTAMALLLVPSFVTNLWQSAVGGNARVILARLWPFLLMATITVWIGVLALTRLNPSLLTALLGVLLVTYAVVNLGGIRLAIPVRHEAWAGPLIGSANGVLTGMTGSFVVPGVMFLQAIGLSRDVLIQAMGMLFTASTVALGLALQQSRILNAEQTIVSASAVVPAIIGMVAGQFLRKRLSEQRFRTVFFVALLLLGAYIIANAARTFY